MAVMLGVHKYWTGDPPSIFPNPSFHHSLIFECPIFLLFMQACLFHSFSHALCLEQNKMSIPKAMGEKYKTMTNKTQMTTKIDDKK